MFIWMRWGGGTRTGFFMSSAVTSIFLIDAMGQASCTFVWPRALQARPQAKARISLCAILGTASMTVLAQRDRQTDCCCCSLQQLTLITSCFSVFSRCARQHFRVSSLATQTHAMQAAMLTVLSSVDVFAVIWWLCARVLLCSC